MDGDRQAARHHSPAAVSGLEVRSRDWLGVRLRERGFGSAAPWSRPICHSLSTPREPLEDFQNGLSMELDATLERLHAIDQVQILRLVHRGRLRLSLSFRWLEMLRSVPEHRRSRQAELLRYAPVRGTGDELPVYLGTGGMTASEAATGHEGWGLQVGCVCSSRVNRRLGTSCS